MAIAKTADELLQKLRSLGLSENEIDSSCGIAKCGCVYHAEESIPCVHDLELLLVAADQDIAEELAATDVVSPAELRRYRQRKREADQVRGVTFNGRPLQASEW